MRSKARYHHASVINSIQKNVMPKPQLRNTLPQKTDGMYCHSCVQLVGQHKLLTGNKRLHFRNICCIQIRVLVTFIRYCMSWVMGDSHRGQDFNMSSPNWDVHGRCCHSLWQPPKLCTCDHPPPDCTYIRQHTAMLK